MNNCLADLSKLIPAHYMKKGGGRVEKTEIIEMAIKHLKDLIESSSAHSREIRPTNDSQLDHRELQSNSSIDMPNSIEDLHSQLSPCEHESYNYLNLHQNRAKVDKEWRISHSSSGSCSGIGYSSSSSSSSSGSSSSSIDSSSSSNYSNSSSDESSLRSGGGCCSCDAKTLGAIDSNSNSSGCNKSNQSATAWYKKAWLVRSFSTPRDERPLNEHSSTDD